MLSDFYHRSVWWDLGVLVQLPRNNIGSAHFILLTTTPTLHPSYLDPQLLPETRDSYSLAQIPVCTTLWYQLVHTTSWSALCAWTLNFSLSVMVLPWNTSRTAESPSHSYFSFLPIQSFRSEWVFHTPPLYLCDCSPHLLAPTHLQPSTVIILWVYSCLFLFQSLLQLSPQSITITKLSCLSTTLFCSSQIILFNTPSFYLKQTTHFLIRCFFTHTWSSPTLW